jgi:hypothetical protein
MSKEALAKVVQRAISDGAFRRQLSSDPGTALRGFDLSADEAAAIRGGDSGRLSALGVDVRMSKAFMLGSDQSGVASPALSNDLGAAYTAANTTGNFGSGVSSALSGNDQSGVSSALTGNDQSGVSSALSSPNGADSDQLITTGDNAGRDSAFAPNGPAHAYGAQTTGDSSTSMGNVLTPGDETSDGVIIIDEGGASGHVTPGEAGHGPSIQE